jgi:hypothetical protein
LVKKESGVQEKLVVQKDLKVDHTERDLTERDDHTPKRDDHTPKRDDHTPKRDDHTLRKDDLIERDDLVRNQEK